MSILNDSGLSSINTVLNLETFYAKTVVENLLTKNSSFPSVKTLLDNQIVITKLKALDRNDSEKVDRVIELFEYYNKKIKTIEKFLANPQGEDEEDTQV